MRMAVIFLKKEVNDMVQQMRSKRYRLTPQREKILRVLMENKDKHLSAEDVFYLLKQKSLDIGLATVYRTLELFLENGVIRSLDFGDGKKRYELEDLEQTHHHHHAICLSCGKIIEIKEDLLEKLEEQVERENNFKIENHELKFFGHCAECRENKR